MKRFKTILVLSIIVSFSLLCTSAFAAPQSNPNGPWVEDNQNVSLSSVMTNAELYKTLEKLEAVSKGKMELELVGYSDALNGDLMEELGYPLYLCKLGNPDADKKMLITTQIHGNEVIGTEAIVELMQKFASGDKEANEILDNVCIWIMPRINPDGAMYQRDGQWYPVRQCVQAWDPESIDLSETTKAPWYYNSNVPGYDENRDYNPNLDFRIDDFDSDEVENFLNDTSYWYTDSDGQRQRYVGQNSDINGGFYVTPEARIVTSVFQRLDPDVYIDVHHRGFNTVSDEDNRSVSIQVAAVVADPYTDPWTGDAYEVDADVLTLGKQINALGWLSLQRGFSSFGAIQKYPDVNLPGTSLGAFALNDTAIMLIEIKGQTQNLGQKQNGMLKQTVSTPIYEILKALSDGSIHDVDESIYNDIPESDNRISDPTTRDDIL
ncbi:MAG: hypothetical protein VR67_18915 [Peptococcaceae bacterium BRH_c8a]|nr:MAG: hypothetical protein VR67_18915 [Peptococcaceae bacterium BRH_c8a]